MVEYSERFLLSKAFGPHVLICTYTGIRTVEVEKIRKYDLQCLDAKTNERFEPPKTAVMFAIKADTLNTVKAGIRIDKDVKARNLRTAVKRKDRPKVLTKETLDRGLNRDVRLVMRSGHVLRGVLSDHSRYNLVLNINGAVVLVYQHGVLEYSVTPLPTETT